VADYFDNFSVFFSGNHIYVSGKSFPLGQISTDILNLDNSVLTEIDRRVNNFMPTVLTMLQEKTDSAAVLAQEKLNAVWDVVCELPLYRDLQMDKELMYELLHTMFSDREKWEAVQDITSDEHITFEKFLNDLECFTENLYTFRGQIQWMLDFYFEPLKRRSADAYAVAYMNYFKVTSSAGAVLFDAPAFEQSFPTEVNFVPMAHPMDEGKVILAEETRFSCLTDFLYTEFYRALAAGNAPRCCHNCGKYFLLTAGYNTCYCNNIAPGETTRTCRKVGAHNKEAQGKANRTPAQVEYYRAYNRLKTRKLRGKISVDEWNTAVAKAQDILDKAERGQLTDEELKRLLTEL